MKKITIFILVLLILALGFFLRIYNIENTPPGIYPDEAVNGKDAIKAFKNGTYELFYTDNNGREGLFINLIALSFSFFGISILALKLPSIVFGTLTILGVYLLSKELFNKRLALISSFLLAISFWAINFSRIAFRAVMLPMLLVFSFYFIFRGLRTKKWWDLVKNKLKLNSSTYVFWSQTYLLEGLQIFQPNRVLIWHHPNLATPTNKMFLWTYDPILYIKFGKPIFQPSFAEKENVDVFKFAKPQSNWKGENKGLHPASKPIKLIMNFVKISSNENDLVLDPFLGAGTTAIACKKLGRHFIGIELNPEYVEMANRRLNFEMLDLGEKDEIL